jgi:glycosyltransferase involved in cell wall biosynthesis
MTDLTIIIPSYQKQSIIRQSLEEKIQILEELGINSELIVVVDGDIDKTFQTIKDFENSSKKVTVKILKHQLNRGKGAAIKTGINQASGDYIGFIDADLDIDSEIISRLYLSIVESELSMVFSNKYNNQSSRITTFGRKIASLIFASIIKLLFNFKTWDTQTGAKIFSRNFAKIILKESKISGFAFDVEIFKLARDYKLKILDIPVHIRTISASTLNIKNQFKTIYEILKLRFIS